MTAGEDQPETVVLHGAVVVVAVVAIAVIRHLAGPQRRSLAELAGLGRPAAQAVQGAVAGRGGEPRAGAARDAIARPALQRRGEGVLRTLLGEVPVTGHPDQGRDHAPPFLLERLGERALDARGHSSQSGLTSIVPYLAAGCLDATSIASSRFSHSSRSKPPICSFVSANGPSESNTSPSRT